MLKNVFALLIVTSLFASCTYEKAEDPEPIPVVEVCDTIAVTYTNTIQALLIANCSIDNDACHSSNAVDFPMDNYTWAQTWASTGQMLSAVTHDGNAEEMPQNADKLDDCKINKIRAWINQGMIE